MATEAIRADRMRKNEEAREKKVYPIALHAISSIPATVGINQCQTARFILVIRETVSTLG